MLFSNIKQKKYKKIRSYTYCIPAPPDRKNGYQEKEFDGLFNHLMSLDFDLIDIKTESYGSEKSSGMWVICILGAKTDKASTVNLDFDYQAVASGKTDSIQLDPSIEHEN